MVRLDKAGQAPRWTGTTLPARLPICGATRSQSCLLPCVPDRSGGLCALGDRPDTPRSSPPLPTSRWLQHTPAHGQSLSRPSSSAVKVGLIAVVSTAEPGVDRYRVSRYARSRSRWPRLAERSARSIVFAQRRRVEGDVARELAECKGASGFRAVYATAAFGPAVRRVRASRRQPQCPSSDLPSSFGPCHPVAPRRTEPNRVHLADRKPRTDLLGGSLQPSTPSACTPQAILLAELTISTYRLRSNVLMLPAPASNAPAQVG